MPRNSGAFRVWRIIPEVLLDLIGIEVLLFPGKLDVGDGKGFHDLGAGVPVHVQPGLEEEGTEYGLFFASGHE